jgi:hypothetical protein
MVNRRTAAAALQLTEATDIIAQQQLIDARDRRQSPLLKRNGNLDTSLLYRALKTSDSSPDPWTKFIWKNKAPPRVQFFWLAVITREDTVQS